MRKIAATFLLTFLITSCSNDDGVNLPSGDGVFFTTIGNAKIEGELFLPDGDGPFPVLIIVPGSGSSPKEEVAAFAPIINSFGYALYIYNKRGIGASTGSYPGETVNDPTPFLEVRAEDVKSIIFFLQTHLDIKSDDIGLFGSSQGTWVNCLVYDDLPADISLMIMISGGATSTGAEHYYEQLIEEHGFSIQEANDTMTNFDGDPGFDPLPIIEAGTTSMLFIYGGADDSHPTRYDSTLVATLNKPELEIHFYPEADHELIEENTGTFPSMLFPKLEAWLPE